MLVMASCKVCQQEASNGKDGLCAECVRTAERFRVARLHFIGQCVAYAMMGLIALWVVACFKGW